MIKLKIKNKHSLNEMPYGMVDDIEDKSHENIKLNLPEIFSDVVDFSIESQPKELASQIYKYGKFAANFESKEGRTIYIKFNVDGDALEASTKPFEDVPTLSKNWLELATKHKTRSLSQEAKAGNWHSANEIPPEGHGGMEEKKDRCYNLAKQKYDVFPSAYASGFIVRCRKGKVGKKRKKKVNENVPQPGESSGKAKEFKSDSKPIKKLMSIDELIKKHPDIPYYKEVLSDYRQKDLSWPVTTKVLEYAKYLKNNPESVENLPPIIFIDDNINDGAHRTSALWLLKNELDKDNPFWDAAKLKVHYFKNKDVVNEGTFDKEKSQGLHGWFARQGAKGKSKGWVDCNTCRTNPETGRKTCKSCGRQSGEKRGKYPACRPTPSACTKSGTSKKKSSKRVSWSSKKEEE